MQIDLCFEDETKNVVVHSVHANSVANYHNKIKPTIMGRKKEVLDAIRQLGGSATLWEIGQLMNKQLHQISGRPGELKKMGLIEDTGILKKHGNSNFTIWKLL